MASKEDRMAALRAELEKVSSEPDEEPFSVQFWETDEKGRQRGGEMPWEQGRRIFGSWFPDLFGDKPAESDDPAQKPSSRAKGDGSGASSGGAEGDGAPGVVRFGRKIG